MGTLVEARTREICFDNGDCVWVVVEVSREGIVLELAKLKEKEIMTTRVELIMSWRKPLSVHKDHSGNIRTMHGTVMMKKFANRIFNQGLYRSSELAV
jgi:hypothetical protein